MKHLNTGIMVKKDGALNVLNYILSLGCENIHDYEGIVSDYYTINSINQIGSNIVGKEMFNSIEEHKAYMKQSKSIAIW